MKRSSLRYNIGIGVMDDHVRDAKREKRIEEH